MELLLPWIDSIVAGVLVTLIIFLMYRNFKLRSVFQTFSDIHMQSLADKKLLEKNVESLYQEIENFKLKDTDGFLKFVSDSRDWAFEYIEEVQKVLSEFDKEVFPELEYYKKYGKVSGETASTTILDKISLEYDKLKDLLPKNTETPNN